MYFCCRSQLKLDRLVRTTAADLLLERHRSSPEKVHMTMKASRDITFLTWRMPDSQNSYPLVDGVLPLDQDHASFREQAFSWHLEGQSVRLYLCSGETYRLFHVQQNSALSIFEA